VPFRLRAAKFYMEVLDGDKRRRNAVKGSAVGCERKWSKFFRSWYGMTRGEREKEIKRGDSDKDKDEDEGTRNEIGAGNHTHLNALADGGAHVGNRLNNLNWIIIQLGIVHFRDPSKQLAWYITQGRIRLMTYLRSLLCTARRASTHTSRSLYSADRSSVIRRVRIARRYDMDLWEFGDILTANLTKSRRIFQFPHIVVSPRLNIPL
jgi:hypothetical protein